MTAANAIGRSWCKDPQGLLAPSARTLPRQAMG